MHLAKTLLAAGLLLSTAVEAQNVLDFPQPNTTLKSFTP